MSGFSLVKAPIVTAVEPFQVVYAEAAALMDLHWEEIARNKHLLKINPDLEAYRQIDSTGNLLAISARVEGRLVGYLVWILTAHPHYKHITIAEDDLHFLLPEYRQGLAGYRFLKSAMGFAEAAGAQMIVMREKIGQEHPALMKRLGVIPTDIIYTKVVE